MSFTLRFWGTRGSIPSPGPATVRYGGNTPCVELRTADGGLIVLDAGTGIRELGRDLMARANGDAIRGDIFLTHAHWDHIQGIPFFAPAFQRGNHFTVWGSSALATSIDRVLRDQMSPVVFPVSFEELAARFDFRELAEGSHVTNGFVVDALAVRHPGGALGYRFTDPAASESSLVYISDNELGEGAAESADPGWRHRLVEFARGARLLVHDATYTPEEYPNHRGWGHSTWRESLQLALDARVETLVLFHHHPDRDDDALDRVVETCRREGAERGMRVVAAREGMTLEV